jgi:predicted nucleic acid-binding protein
VLADTSFLIATSDRDHKFHEDASFLCEKFAEYDVKIFVNVTARSEFIDYHRRVVLTETLMDMLALTSPWKISKVVREELKSQRGWLDNELHKGRDALLNDSRIKECKQVFLPRTHSGQIGWLEICKEFLSGKLLKVWEELSSNFDLNYVDMRSAGSGDLFRKVLQWESVYRLAEETGLGSQDAMILNLFDCSVFPMLVTMDFDLAYGVLGSVADKTVFVPDNLFRNRIKKLRF